MKLSSSIITNVKDYIDEVLQLHEQNKENGNLKLFFRGQKDSSWQIRPYIFRDRRLANEYEVIHEATRQCPADFRDCSNYFDILTKLQHYGVGTRLLDLTINPLVALYFATEEFNDFVRNDKNHDKFVPKDGVVYIKSTYTMSLDRIETRIACALSFIDFSQSLTIKQLLNELKIRGTITADEFENYLVKDDYKRFIDILQKHYFIMTPHSNDRLIKQSGAFIIPTAINIFDKDDDDKKLEKAHCNLREEFDEVSFLIPANAKGTIREELNFLNVNEATLFPELEHQMRYIDQSCHQKSSGSAEFILYKKVEEVMIETQLAPSLSEIENVVIDTLPKGTDVTLVNEIVSLIQSLTSIVDWNNKESSKATLRVTVSKKLSANNIEKSKILAEKIFIKLLQVGNS